MALLAYRYRILVENSTGVSGKSYNVFSVGSDAVVSDANVALILGDLNTFYTAITTHVYGTYSIGSRILEYQPTGPPRIVSVAAVGRTNNAASPLPAQLALCVNWRTALAGRSYRGRTFLGPLNGAANSTSGGVTGAAITAVNNACAALITAVKPRTTGSHGLIVHSDQVPTDTDITLGTTDTRMDTMRTRS